jgi:hypothetical protein
LKALEALKSGEVDSAGVYGCGRPRLDIKDVPAVFFDLPFNAEDLLHRIGRTGRCRRVIWR